MAGRRDRSYQHSESALAHPTETVLPSQQHQWPRLGQELFTLEHALVGDSNGQGLPMTQQQQREQLEKIRSAILAQLYRREGNHSLDARYLAFLLLQRGRGGEIVGNPSARGNDGKQQELPYTGLEGYYAGSERTPDRPGISREDILQEEADIGAQLLKAIKKHAIDHDSWSEVTRLKKALAWKSQDLEEIRSLQVLWGTIVRRLHVRVYHNPEFEPTLTEQIEHLDQLLSRLSEKNEEEKRAKAALQAEYRRLIHEHESMGEAERQQERQERRKRAWIRAERLEAFRHFQDETYRLLTESSQGHYTVGVQDASLAEATITETITLPTIPARTSYPYTCVHFTPEQLEGYLFLAKLGEIGGNPLARSVLVSS